MILHSIHQTNPLLFTFSSLLMSINDSFCTTYRMLPETKGYLFVGGQDVAFDQIKVKIQTFLKENNQTDRFKMQLYSHANLIFLCCVNLYEILFRYPSHIKYITKQEVYIM